MTPDSSTPKVAIVVDEKGSKQKWREGKKNGRPSIDVTDL